MPLLQPALDTRPCSYVWPVATITGSFQELHGDRAQEVREGADAVVEGGRRLAALVLDADVHLRVHVKISAPTSRERSKTSLSRGKTKGS